MEYKSFTEQSDIKVPDKMAYTNSASPEQTASKGAV